MSRNIQDYVAERGIKHLLHFTRESNLASILERGLLQRNELEGGSARFNDAYRMDRTNAICLSISHPNYKMFFSLRRDNPEEKWVVIGISPSVLWTLPCAFCATNAASNAVTAIPINQRMGLTSFQSMFNDWGEKTRATLGIGNHYPTNPQAEVLVLSSIPTQFILGVAADNAVNQQRLQVTYPGSTIIAMPSFYNGRPDFAHWRTT